MATPPGENGVYCSASPNLALGMVGRAMKEFPIYSFDRLIAGPMKISNYTIRARRTEAGSRGQISWG
jgi:hypothetical protein